MLLPGRYRTPMLVALVAWVSPGWAADDRFRAVRELIREEIDDGRVPSLAVAVARRGEIVWEEAFGWADRERGNPATPHTMFSLASVSKPLTATGLMVLVQSRAVDLERPINDYRLDGGMPGATTTLVLIPRQKIAVAVLCGTKSDLPQRVATKVLAILRAPYGRRVDAGSGESISGRGWRGCHDLVITFS